MITQIQNFLTAQMDRLVLVGMIALVVLSALQLAKMSRTNRQLKYLTDRLSGYLQAVLADEDEEDTQTETEFVSRQEQDMRESIALQKQKKREREAQVMDAVLSEIFP